MNWNEILDKLNNDTLSQVYLLYGSEKYLINDFITKSIDKYVPTGMNDLNVVSLNTKNYKRLKNGCMTPPFMADKRIIIIEDDEYFTCPKSRYESEIFQNMLNLTDSLIHSENNDVLVLFVSVDKITASNPIVKLLKKNDCIVSYNKITDSERSKIAVNLAKKYNKKLSLSDAAFLVEYVGSEMFKIKNELDKLVDYSSEAITRKDIEAICSPSIDYNVFQMIKAITSKNSNGAFSIYRDMIRNGEYVGAILSLIARQYRVYAFIEDIDKNFADKAINFNELEQRLGIKHFVIKTMYSKGKRLSQDDRKKIVNSIIDADYLVKIGEEDANTAIENLIFKLVG